MQLPSLTPLVRRIVPLLLAVLLTGLTRAAVIEIHPGDDYRKIESARAGDEVLIWPGTYRFRVYLTAQGTSAAPIYIHAQDPANRPIWDMSSPFYLEDASGSRTTGDRGRGAWQFNGATHYHLAGIVFTHCRSQSQNGAGIRYYGGTRGLQIKDCQFADSDNGITGGSQQSEAVIEYSEFARNGNTAASAATHNMYIYGGTFTLRYCFVHDSVQAENFHVRAEKGVLEYNLFARAASYEGDFMTSIDLDGSVPVQQTMLLRGNVFVQDSSPDNHVQVIAVLNDTRTSNVQFAVQAISNTYVGNNTPGAGGSAAFMHLINGDGTPMTATLTNNIIFGTNTPAALDNAGAGSISGTRNLLPVGASTAYLQGSIFAATPGFKNAASGDYTLAKGSAAIQNAAAVSADAVPIKEYFSDASQAMKWRVRNSASDIGAFESTSLATPVGPYDPTPLPALRAERRLEGWMVSWPVTGRDFTLEETQELGSGWSTVTSPYEATTTGYQWPVTPTVGSQFFRLRLP